MTWLKTVWSEFIGLFVDDGSLAVAGLASILVESALRRALRGS